MPLVLIDQPGRWIEIKNYEIEAFIDYLEKNFNLAQLLKNMIYLPHMGVEDKHQLVTCMLGSVFGPLEQVIVRLVS